ncbi:hypothetical protein MASR1M31_23190 [Porphyromonadaceae bacterium]
MNQGTRKVSPGIIRVTTIIILAFCILYRAMTYDAGNPRRSPSRVDKTAITVEFQIGLANEYLVNT